MKLPEAVELDLALTQSLYDQSRLRLWSLLLSMKRQGKKKNECHCASRGATCGKNSTLIHGNCEAQSTKTLSSDIG